MITTTVDFDSDREKLGFYRVLKALKGKFNIEIKRVRKKRSNPQNNYYFGVVVNEISRSTGFFPDEVHDLLKRKFLSFEKANPITGEACVFAKSTTGLTTQEFEQYCEQIRIWCISELDIYIPEPSR